MTARKRTKLKTPTGGGVTRMASMPPSKRRRRDSLLKMVGLKAWDEVFDGGVYKIELPPLDEQEETMRHLILSMRAALRYRDRESGKRRVALVHRESDKVILIQVVDE